MLFRIVGVAAKEIPLQCYALVDLYGQCERITVVSDDSPQNTQPLDYREKADLEDSKQKSCVRENDLWYIIIALKVH